MEPGVIKVRGGRYINVWDVESFERVTLENASIFYVIAGILRFGSYFYANLHNKERVMITFSDYERIISIKNSYIEWEMGNIQTRRKSKNT